MTGSPGRDLWGAAQAYEQYMGRWSRQVAPLFLTWLNAPAQQRWVDLGCGTGALTGQIARTCAPRALLGVDTAEGFLQAAARAVPGAAFQAGDVSRTGLPGAAFDCAVSGLVLNFTPSPHAALQEMTRLVRPGGLVGLYVWDYAGHMQIMRRFFDAARTIDPGAAAFDDGVNAPVCRPAPLRAALASAGLRNVLVAPLDLTAAFANFDEYWTPFLGATGSAPKYYAGLPPGVQGRIRDAVRAALPTGPDGEILLAVRAWAARGQVPDT